MIGFILWYLEVREVFSHEAVDLTHRQTSSFAALQSHEDQDTAAKTHKWLHKVVSL